MSGKSVGRNSTFLVMSEGLFCSMGVNPHGHFQVLLLRETQLLAPSVMLEYQRGKLVGFAQEERWRPEFMFTAVGGQFGDELVDLGCLPLSVTLFSVRTQMLFPGFRAQLASVSVLAGPWQYLCCC